MIQIYINKRTKDSRFYNQIRQILIHHYLRLQQQAHKVVYILIFNNFLCKTHYKEELMEATYQKMQDRIIILHTEQVDFINNFYILILIFLDRIMILTFTHLLLDLLYNKIIIQD